MMLGFGLSLAAARSMATAVVWLLATGIWSDGGAWKDDAVW